MQPKLPRGKFYGETLKSKEVAGLLLTEMTYPAGLVIGKHSHESASFCLIVEGTYSEVYGRRSRLCKPLSLIFHPSDEIHSNYIHRAGRDFSLEFTPQWVERIRDYSKLLNDPVEFQGGTTALLSLKLYREFQDMDEVSSLAIESLTLEIIVAASRQRPFTAESRKPRWFKQAEEMIHAGFAKSLHVNDIAESVGVHPVYFAGEFRKYYRCTVADYVRQLRITTACRELSGSNKSLARIALAVGFYDQSHFSRTFKRLMGMTPVQYRKLMSTHL